MSTTVYNQKKLMNKFLFRKRMAKGLISRRRRLRRMMEDLKWWDALTYHENLEDDCIPIPDDGIFKFQWLHPKTSWVEIELPTLTNEIELFYA